MPTNAEQMIIDRYALLPHPEGGWYSEVVRSSSPVCAVDGRERSALTSIYFLLDRDAVSRWHRVLSDELWIFLEGHALALHMYNETTGSYSVTMLNDAHRQQLIPAGVWQAAMPVDEYALCACAVAPGFEFADFTMIGPDHAETLALMIHKNPLAKRFA